jgi:Arc/MetJ-type ribon-helix-helix transcriptional regulator
MTTIALRLADETLAAIDALVADGTFSTRTDAVRNAIDALLRAQARSETDRSIIDGYTRLPQTDDEVAFATAATRALISDEPW